MHIHISSGDSEAKFWLEPSIELVSNYNFSEKQLSEIEDFINDNRNDIIKAWKQHFKS